ncbi:MAG TPA: MaoC family dehydratase N-terminal domain-containing protein [Rugosimonospora sp.]|nr:MaoC family dehydratase N-terminal domain-containing protein [Rugosimonospora sp.]
MSSPAPAAERPRVQDEPVVGMPLPESEITIGANDIRMYVNAVGDEAYWAFQARTLARTGDVVPPITLLDRDLTARIVGGPGVGIGFHAKQEFRFHGTPRVGERYRISGEVADVSERRGIGYFTTLTRVSPVDAAPGAPGTVLLESLYTRAFRFPRQQYPRGSGAPKLRFGEWLTERTTLTGNPFPQPGAIVEGRTSRMDQGRLSLYSDQDSVLHTDPMMARRRGLSGTVAQALMTTELELELYRDLFGLALYRRGEIRAKYIEPIPVDCSLRAVCVVTGASDELITLSSAVATTTGNVVSLADVTVRHWRTEDDVAE